MSLGCNAVLSGRIALESTLESGQCFRWKPLGKRKYLGVVEKVAVVAAERPGALEVSWDSSEGNAEEVARYFSLDDDLDVIEAELSSCNPVMKRVVEFGSGIRVLRQPPWECLASYLLSSQNNISRISGMVDRITRTSGDPAGFGLYSFPSPEAVCNNLGNVLEQARCGFRGDYLAAAATMVALGKLKLDEIAGLPTKDAREVLMSLKGVGPKIADCVLLYAYHRGDVFPVDVWMVRAMRELFGCGGMTPRAVRDYGLKMFGELAGYAQLYIYNYVRRSAGWSSSQSK